MKRKISKSDKVFERIGLKLLVIIVCGLLLTEIITWNPYRFYYKNYYSWILGFGSWIIFYLYPQRIVDQNLFKRFTIIGLSIFIVSWLKQALTTYDVAAMFISLIPLIYINLFRLLILIFFSKYKNINKFPTIITCSRYNIYWRGKERGYRPTVKEKLLSFLTLYGTIAIIFAGIIFIGKNHY